MARPYRPSRNGEAPRPPTARPQCPGKVVDQQASLRQVASHVQLVARRVRGEGRVRNLYIGFDMSYRFRYTDFGFGPSSRPPGRVVDQGTTRMWPGRLTVGSSAGSHWVCTIASDVRSRFSCSRKGTSRSVRTLVQTTRPLAGTGTHGGSPRRTPKHCLSN
jgi:hypothetical protein